MPPEIFGTEHCIYCGDYYQCRDHVIPVAYASVFRSYKPGTTVHCCRQCNTLLGDKAHFTIQDRANYLATAYREKYAKEITFPYWEEHELAEMHYNHRKQIEKKLRLKVTYLKKLDNLELCSQGFEIVPIDPLIFHGKTITPVLSMIDTLSSLEQFKYQDDKLKSRLRYSITINLKNGILYRTYRHKDGRTVNVINLREFKRRYKLKYNFEQDSEWKFVRSEEVRSNDVGATLEVAINLIKSGKVMC